MLSIISPNCTIDVSHVYLFQCEVWVRLFFRMASGKSSTASNAYHIYYMHRIIYDSTYMLRDTTIGGYANTRLSAARAPPFIYCSRREV